MTLPPVDVNGLLPNTAAAAGRRPVSLALLAALRLTVQRVIVAVQICGQSFASR